MSSTSESAELVFTQLGEVEYLAAWELQQQVHGEVVARTRPDTVLVLTHPAVYTAGKRTDDHERPVDTGGAPVIDVDRGGKITFHGPGQLVMYPIVHLPDHVKVVDFVRRLEEAMIRTAADFGVATGRVPGRSGVWVAEDAHGPERKLAAIGLRISKGVTMHGLSYNCDVDLSWYDRFISCGITDAGVTSLALELGRDVTVEELAPMLERHTADLLSWQPYESSPDFDAKPEPEHLPKVTTPRIELLTPANVG